MHIRSANGIHSARTQNESTQQTSLSTRLKKMANSFRSFSIASLFSKKPATPAADAGKQLEDTNKRLTELKSLPGDFKIRGISEADYQLPIQLLSEKADALSNGVKPKDIKSFNEKIEKATSELYTKIKAIEQAPLMSDLSKAEIKQAVTDRNRASNVATTLIERGKNEPWAQALRNNPHPRTH